MIVVWFAGLFSVGLGYRFGLLFIVVGCLYLVRFLSRFCCGFWVVVAMVCVGLF